MNNNNTFGTNFKMDKRKSKSTLLLFLLVFYVMLQLLWWGYLLSQLNKEVVKYKIENISYTITTMQEREAENKLLEKKLQHRLWMILGEGSVFVIILAFGVYRLLKVMNAEAELNKRQHNFLLSVTHELKSPLASARLQLETVLKRHLEREKQDNIITNAITDLDRLNLLTDNILTAAQLENRNIQLKIKEENVSEALNRILNSMQLKKQNRKLHYKIANNIYYSIDANAFASIVTNLVENAIKYSSNDSVVEIFLTEKNEKLYLKVSDSGIGISDKEKLEIFKKFYRVGNENTRNTKGTGLGLFITKQLVDAHNGIIKVENNFNKGTTFTVVL